MIVTGSSSEAPVVLLDPGRWPQRAVRAWVFALVSVALAVSAHRLAGGMTADLRVDSAGGLTLFGLGLALSGRERSGRVISAVVLTTQVALHVAFTLATRHGTTGPSPVAQWAKAVLCAPATHPATAAQVNAIRAGMDLAPLPPAAAMNGPMTHMPATWSALGLAMLTAHVAAAAGTAWWLRRGERAAWSLAAHAARAFVFPVHVSLVPVGRVATTVTGRVFTPMPRVWADTVAGRGPPTPAVFRSLTA